MSESSNAAKAFVVNEDKLLIVKRRDNDVHKPGIWEIPGGRLEKGEDIVKGLKREVREETGLEIEILNKLSTRKFTREDGQEILLSVFLCKAVSNDIKLSEEHTAYEWMDLDEKDKLTPFFNKEVEIYKKIKR